jgi:hypothetical protein
VLVYAGSANSKHERDAECEVMQCALQDDRSAIDPREWTQETTSISGVGESTSSNVKGMQVKSTVRAITKAVA